MDLEGNLTLPTYEIVETREKPESEPWLHGIAPGFEILSSASEAQTRKLVFELQRFRIALGAVWPDALRRAGPPVTLVLCGRGNTFDAFAPYDPERRRANSAAASRLLAGDDQTFLVVDLTRREIQMVDDENFRVLGSANSSNRVMIDHYHELIRAYVRFLVQRPTPPAPPWLAEGLTQLIASIKYDRQSISFGELSPSVSVREGPQAVSRVTAADSYSGEPGQAGGQAELIEGPIPSAAEPRSSGRTGSDDFTGRRSGVLMMPMDEFFAVQRDSPAATQTIGTNWALQAHAFVHLCIYGENHRFQKGFFEFIARLQNERLTEALFIECFKMDYRKFAGFLRRYTASAWYKSERFELEKGKLPEPEPITLNDATATQIARIQGDALLLARGEDNAFRVLVGPYREGDRDPDLLASLGLVEARLGHADNARRLLESATHSRVDRPRAYTELVRLRLASYAATARTPDAKLSQVQVAAALRPLFAARTIRPAVPETYALIAEIWERSANPPTKDNLAVLLEGAALFPSESTTLLRAARLHQSIGLLREAGALADLGATWATDAPQKAALLAFKSSLPPEAQIDLAKTAKPPPGKGSKSKPRP